MNVENWENLTTHDVLEDFDLDSYLQDGSGEKFNLNNPLGNYKVYRGPEASNGIPVSNLLRLPARRSEQISSFTTR